MNPRDSRRERIRHNRNALQEVTNTDMPSFSREMAFYYPPDSTLVDAPSGASIPRTLGPPFRNSSSNTHQAASTRSKFGPVNPPPPYTAHRIDSLPSGPDAPLPTQATEQGIASSRFEQAF